MKIRYVAHKALNNKGQVVASCLQTPAGICGFRSHAAVIAVDTRAEYKSADYGYSLSDNTLPDWKERVRDYGAVRFQKVIVEREVQS